MFNRATFNRALFNRCAEVAEPDTQFCAIFEENHHQYARLTDCLEHVLTIEGSIKAKTNVGAGTFPEIVYADGLDSLSVLTSAFNQTISAVGDIDGYSRLTKELLEIVLGDTKTNCYGRLTASLHLEVVLSDAVEADTPLLIAAIMYSAAISEQIRTHVSVTRLLYNTLSGAAEARCKSQMSAGLFISADYEGSTKAAVNGTIGLSLTAAADAQILQRAEACADERYNVEAVATIADIILMCVDCAAKITAKDAVEISAKLGAIYDALFEKNFRNATATVNAFISSSAAADSVFEINIAIPPGGTLIIDSENYTVTLNGENVLHAQSGEWIYISRSTQAVSLDITDNTNTQEISGVFGFRERYL